MHITKGLIQDVLNERIWEVLNDCWDRRDPSGGMADPLPNTGQKGLGLFLKDCWDWRYPRGGIADPLPSTGLQG